jgi:hypothetical protein
LRRHRPGVRISRGLAHRLLELRDSAAAGTGMRRSDAEAKGGGNEQGWSMAHSRYTEARLSIETCHGGPALLLKILGRHHPADATDPRCSSPLTMNDFHN